MRPARLFPLTMPLFGVVSLSALAFSLAGCSPGSPASGPSTELPRDSEKGLPLAYPRSHIIDPEVREVAEQLQAWVLGRLAGPGKVSLYSRVEILPPTQTVQPYGVGAFQQELRLPAILTTGPGWKQLEPTAKEAEVAQVFREMAGRLDALQRKPPLRPTLTIQTPEGLVLGWINHLDPTVKNLHEE